MKSKINFLLAALTLIILLQSCLKDHGPIVQLPDDKLLLSKVTGIIQSKDATFQSPLLNNFYTYKWKGVTDWGLPDDGDFEINYLYDTISSFRNTYKSLSRETFLNLSGHYDFTYDNHIPQKVTDNSWPGRDYGYWQFYYNYLHQVNKVGLAFSTTTSPARYEFYNRDFSNRINSFIYGRAVDTPYMKVEYQYNYKGDISAFNVYTAKTSFPGSGNTPVNANSLPAKKIELSHERLNGPTISNRDNNGIPLTSFTSSIDTSVYEIYLTAKVTTDNKINPFSQQDNLLFYQTNRWYSFYDVTTFFQALSKSNATEIDYQVWFWYDNYPQYFPNVSSATQTFTYNYNSKGYPVSIHEDFTDPDDVIMGDYTRDSQIQYTSNH